LPANEARGLMAVLRLVGDKELTLLLTFVIVLDTLPAVMGAASSESKFLEAVIFTCMALAAMVLYLAWLRKQVAVWARLALIALVYTLATAYTALFSPIFPNAYLSFILAVQVIFLLLGPRYGVVMLCLAMVADFYHVLFISNGVPSNLMSNLFALSVQATVGCLSWLFLSSAVKMSDRAEQAAIKMEQLARDAMAARIEAERLSEEVSRLNRMIITSQDNERRRLARDIHDGPLQSLGVELLAIDRVKRRLDLGETEKARLELHFLRELAEEVVSDLRGTVGALRNSLLDSGLEPALQNLARKVSAATGLDIVVSVSIQQELSGKVENCIYQLAVEALNNVKKHARAWRVDVLLSDVNGILEFSVHDDGVGYNYEESLIAALSAGHIGLYSLQERALELGGTMKVSTSPGMGTHLSFYFPTLPAAEAREESPRHKVPALR
jgi:signal transduction histidine kinase